MGLTCEWLLTSPQAFGLITATPVQRAICRVADGLPLDDLATHPRVIAAFGGEAAIERLPLEKPDQLDVLAAIRGAKSLLCAVGATRAALTVDLSPTLETEPVHIPILSLTKRKAAAVFKHLRGPFTTKPALLVLLARTPTVDTVSIRRPHDGRVIDVVVMAGATAGAAVVANWCASLVFDEAPRMSGADERTVNFDDTRTAALGRILPGGQIWAVGSPWAPKGPIYNDVLEYFGKPSRVLVVIRAPGPDMNPVWWTQKRCEALRNKPRGELAYTTDVLAEFGKPASSLFSEPELRRAMRDEPDAAPCDEVEYGAAMDPGTRGNAWTFAIVGRAEGPTEAETRFVVARVRQWQGSAAEPLVARVVFAEMAEELQQYGLSEVVTDQWGYDPFRELAEDAGITLVLDTRTKAQQDREVIKIHTRIVAQPAPLVELPPDEHVRRDFLGIRKRLTTAGGVSLELLRTPDGRHSDYVPTIEKGVFVVGQGAGWMRAMTEVVKRGGKMFAEPEERSPAAAGMEFCERCNMNHFGPCPKHGKAV